MATSFPAVRSKPEFYNCLDTTLTEAWAVIERGAANRTAACHTPAVATIGLDGTPRVRVVVLRAADRSTRTLRFHTDGRGAKIDEIAANPAISLLFYDPALKVQIRLCGHARVHAGDQIAEDAWARSQAMSRLCYTQDLTPGATVDDPTLVTTSQAGEDGHKNFRAVSILANELEWLYLEHEGHRRARFVWAGDNLTSCWLAP